ncbi:hypothetical protein LTR28_007282 [Elasticomyces elasticus]|nr:hypothetical protein LTR28_007282 [Elasticomyces elasticus]
MPTTTPLTALESLSGISGSISLACWIFLLVPQLLENYRTSSADGISLTFLLVWFVGDVANLSGALWARLVPTVCALAAYFCVADLVLIAQCVYYNWVNERRRRRGRGEVVEGGGGGETSPLLRPRVASAGGLPGSRRRSSAASRRSSKRASDLAAARADGLAGILEEEARESARGGAWVKNGVSVVAIVAVGAVGWAVAWKTGAWTPTPVDAGEGAQYSPRGAQVLGYASAVAYLGARIPQIIKNQREKSCQGLSLLFFLLSLLGNATYGAGILLHSQTRPYLLTNLPWLIGSLGTMAEDAAIFVQFHLYGDGDDDDDDDDGTAVEAA